MIYSTSEHNYIYLPVPNLVHILIDSDEIKIVTEH